MNDLAYNLLQTNLKNYNDGEMINEDSLDLLLNQFLNWLEKIDVMDDDSKKILELATEYLKDILDFAFDETTIFGSEYWFSGEDWLKRMDAKISAIKLCKRWLEQSLIAGGGITLNYDLEEVNDQLKRLKYLRETA